MLNSQMHQSGIVVLFLAILAVAGCSGGSSGTGDAELESSVSAGETGNDQTARTGQADSEDPVEDKRTDSDSVEDTGEDTRSESDTDGAVTGPSGQPVDTVLDGGQHEVDDTGSEAEADPLEPLNDDPSGGIASVETDDNDSEPLFEPEVVGASAAVRLGRPVNAQVEISENSIKVSWNQVNGAEDYSVIWQNVGTGILTEVFTSGVVQWQIGNLQSGATYEIWVAAIDTHGMAGISTITLTVTVESKGTTSDMGP